MGEGGIEELRRREGKRRKWRFRKDESREKYMCTYVCTHMHMYMYIYTYSPKCTYACIIM